MYYNLYIISGGKMHTIMFTLVVVHNIHLIVYISSGCQIYTIMYTLVVIVKYVP